VPVTNVHELPVGRPVQDDEYLHRAA
jgi:hypothetical protein